MLIFYQENAPENIVSKMSGLNTVLYLPLFYPSREINACLPCVAGIITLQVAHTR